MIYALNVFNLKPENEEDYKKYSIKAGKIIYSKDGKVVSSGWKPIRNIHGDIKREYMVVVEFPNEKIFQEFLDEAEKENIHPLREESTKDYIWTLYEHWNIREWVSKT